jgi:uncharacterized membrane protein (DUF2068 family)
MGAAKQRDVPPGVVRPGRFLPPLHYELLICALRGHELVGTDAAELRAQDELFARQIDTGRWYRCLRCDSWVPLPPPSRPDRRHPPAREEIELPLRGKPLRDKIVLRAIAVDRAVHFLVLAILAVAVFALASHESSLRAAFFRVLADVQGGAGGPLHDPHGKFATEVDKLLSLKPGTLRLLAAALLAYAVLEGAEAVGLWFQRRWAEYLTFIATSLLLPLELYELSRTLSALKLIALFVNLAIVTYLLFAKRLFGLRGGVEAEEALRRRDVGWQAIERTGPPPASASRAAAPL